MFSPTFLNVYWVGLHESAGVSVDLIAYKCLQPPLSGYWLMRTRQSMELSWVGRSSHFRSNQFYLSPVFIHDHHSRHWNNPFVSMKQNRVAFLMIMSSWQADCVGEWSDVMGRIFSRNVSSVSAAPSLQKVSKKINQKKLKVEENKLFVCWVSDLQKENSRLAELSQNLCAWRSVGECRRGLCKELCLSMFAYSHPSF